MNNLSVPRVQFGAGEEPDTFSVVPGKFFTVSDRGSLWGFSEWDEEETAGLLVLS